MPEARPARALILDYGGVVRREDEFEFDAFAARHGLAPGRLWAAFHDVPEYGPSRRGEIADRDYRAAVLRALAADLGRAGAERLLAEWDEVVGGQAPIEPEMAGILRRARGRVRLGLLSNAGAGGTRRFQEAGVSALFDDVVASGDVGLAKPDVAIYRLAANRLGVEPPDCLFVDDMARNVAGARAAGMRAHLHHRTRMPALVSFLEEHGALDPGERGA
jgi:HAD superfamily hydrolase (TIGR01509 family)